MKFELLKYSQKGNLGFLTFIKNSTFEKSNMKSNSIKYQSTMTTPNGVAIAATTTSTTTTTTP
ncbi:hypothetical protein GKZ90_0009340 [Flavobacterium sp. MC2016-06]|uniref:hypothetical protein n=1 Tax=Flavobacterium sp. MC2016-06 TaxID=2676308 RepID=UPI0012BA5D26|nr:hypothetical protein [Flavobacterium sp. MC2016-06]MBU3859331.1 hypothetical protein [Flavobacterium sp. MC2016-06]